MRHVSQMQVLNAGGNEVFLQMAKENCENTVKALLMPIIENQDESYELVIQ